MSGDIADQAVIGSLIGNMPQALTHLALVNTALFLSGPVIQRAGG